MSQVSYKEFVESRGDNHSLSEKEYADLALVFKLIDQDGSGSISNAELGFLMKSIGQNPTPAELQDMINEADTNHNGTIELNEFVELMAKKINETNKEDEMMEAFSIFDRNGDGYITESELKLVMNYLGEQLSEDEMRKMISEADIDGDGKVNYTDFKKFMLNESDKEVNNSM